MAVFKILFYTEPPPGKKRTPKTETVAHVESWPACAKWLEDNLQKTSLETRDAIVRVDISRVDEE